jgi:uncharacterized protein
MRLNPDIADYLKQAIQGEIPGSAVYLFGSRVDEKAHGGDIDLLILSDEPADKRIFRKIRMEFYKKYGWRKVDMVNLSYTDNSSFRKLIEKDCMKL